MSTEIVAGGLSVIAAILTLIAAVIQFRCTHLQRDGEAQPQVKAYDYGSSALIPPYKIDANKKFRIRWPDIFGASLGTGLGLGILDAIGVFGAPWTLNTWIDGIEAHLISAL